MKRAFVGSVMLCAMLALTGIAGAQVKVGAIVIGASGTPAALPARTVIEQGYKGKLHSNHGVANNGFLRVGGKDVEGGFVPRSPVNVAAHLPESHPAKQQALEYIKVYEKAFGSYAWDACLELANAIPQALKVAQPGTKSSTARCVTPSKRPRTSPSPMAR